MNLNRAPVNPQWREGTEQAFGGSLEGGKDEIWQGSPFGRVMAAFFPWVLHESLGWVYVAGEAGHHLWLCLAVG